MGASEEVACRELFSGLVRSGSYNLHQLLALLRPLADDRQVCPARISNRRAFAQGGEMAINKSITDLPRASSSQEQTCVQIVTKVHGEDALIVTRAARSMEPKKKSASAIVPRPTAQRRKRSTRERT